jgi:hypothetical protein
MQRSAFDLPGQVTGDIPVLAGPSTPEFLGETVVVVIDGPVEGAGATGKSKPFECGEVL